jgi:hypothetical protein
LLSKPAAEKNRFGGVGVTGRLSRGGCYPKEDEPMKTLLFAAALMLGGAAYAQDTGHSGGGTGMAPGGTSAPSNASPKRDARGVPVVSAPAEAPAGYNQPPNSAGAAPSTGTSPTMAPAGPLPPCTRKVTDHCTQTYERHRSGGGAGMASSGGGDAAAATTDMSGGGDSATTTTTTTTKKKTTHHRRRHKK